MSARARNVSRMAARVAMSTASTTVKSFFNGAARRRREAKVKEAHRLYRLPPPFTLEECLLLARLLRCGRLLCSGKRTRKAPATVLVALEKEQRRERGAILRRRGAEASRENKKKFPSPPFELYFYGCI